MKAEAAVAKRKNLESVPPITDHGGGEKLSVEKLLDLYSRMLRIRRFEEAAFQQYQKGTIGGFCHLYIGQEAVAVGACSVLERGDKVLTAYRDHGHALALGMTSDELMAELFGKITGCSKGKGGSMHFFDEELGMLGGNGIVGSHVPVATGVAFAQKYKGDKKVTLCFFGDGAAQQGAVHEAMNLAGLWRLPIVFVVENNMYGMGTSLQRSSATLELYQRAHSYNFPGVVCNGMDVLDVRAKFSAAVSIARATNTPTFIEAKTYRYRGHSMSDPALYRTQDEVEKMKNADPILMLKSDLLKRGVAESKLEAVDQAAKDEAKASVEFAGKSEVPPVEELKTDIYAKPWDESLLPRVVLPQ
ncbi:MAG TPA: pyruvate dehydrogenase (acetyl-transferring) E1 component subunit alpha [Planctomycetota bacterium]|nr:pyruvate dehydrogenase (acetyl-transferring) E1 component subunit alpha [Planctomycetota bacterium]